MQRLLLLLFAREILRTVRTFTERPNIFGNKQKESSDQD